MAITGTSTFSNIMNVAKLRDDSHQDKALKHTAGRPLYQASSLMSHTTRKREGADFIKASLNREFGAQFGPNFAQRVFVRANGYQPGLNLDAVVKGRDLASINKASHNIRAEDTIASLRQTLGSPAQNINGTQVKTLVDIISNPLVNEGTKFLAERMLRESLSTVTTFDAMKATLTSNGKLITAQEAQELVHLTRPDGSRSFDANMQALIEEASTPGAGGVTPGNVQELQSQLPQGAVISPSGQISGTTVINSFGRMFQTQTGLQNPSFVDIMLNIGKQSLASDGIKLDNGLTIGTQAERDLYRMNITMHDGNKPPYSSTSERDRIENEFGEQSVGKLTNMSITTAMKDLARGDQNTVRVLTSVINQQFSTPFVRGLTLPDGSPFSPAVCGARDGNQQVGTPNGVEMRDPGGIGSADIQLTRLPNGDIQVDITYPFTLKRPTMDHDSRFAGAGDTTVQGTGRVGYIIDGAQARLGKLDIQPNLQASVTWDGHMTV